MRIPRWFRRLDESLLFLPAVTVVAMVVLAVATVALDETLADRFPTAGFFRGSIDSARSLLSSIGTMTVTLMGLLFSITMLVLSMTSSQYSPRVLRTFLTDRNSQFTLSVFVGTFVYAMAVLRTLEEDTEAAVSMSLAVAFGLLTVGAFIQYINHMAQSIQASSIITSVGDDTASAIERQYRETVEAIEPPPAPSPHPDHVVTAAAKGVLRSVGIAELVRTAADSGCRLELAAAVGEFVPKGGPLVLVWGTSEIDEGAARRALELGRIRSMRDDPAYGFRQLVDIAERALSPGTNDPTTAVQAVDQIHDLLRQLADTPLPTGVHRDEQGEIRLIVRERTWDEFVDLAVDEVLHYGADSIQVRRRLEAMLEDVLAAARPLRRPAVEAKLERVRRAAAEERSEEPGRRSPASG